ncbi:MAG: hypothetical protein NC548_61035 [Lachnospiraceae bacterium]|nr:hypothetical protein [Lachnospiraceae bacterium]
MPMTLYSNVIADYLKRDDVVDFDDESVAKCAESLFQRAGDGTPFIRAAYEFVRDKIAHSADIGQKAMPCSASEVIAEGMESVSQSRTCLRRCFGASASRRAFATRRCF